MSAFIRLFVLLCVVLIVIEQILVVNGARGGRRRGGKGKNLLPFGNVAEYSLVSAQNQDPNAAKITKGSHFSQTFKLGYKILLICIAEGNPRPSIKWYKDGSEVITKLSTHFYEKHIGNDTIWSKIEIDPATMGDQGVYTCMANNDGGLMIKNFKAEYEL